MPTIPQNPPAPRGIEFVAFPQVQLLDVAGPLQVFASANALRAAGGAAPAYATAVVARSAQVVSSAGLRLAARRLSRPDRPVDTLIVAGGAGIDAASRDPALVGWLAERARVARRVASVCTGAFLLASAGLLDGRRAVTHWADCTSLARRFPRVRVETDPIFVRDGPVWTSAGVTAGIDLALALVESDLGHAAAMAVARELVVFLKRPGGQAQFSAALDLQARGRGFEELHAWILEHLSGDLSVATLADRAGMSERSFLRRYVAATGTTPARAIARMRVEAARQALIATRVPLKRVAERCGFGSEETLRRRFCGEVGVTPREYRARFATRPALAARAR